MANKSKKKNTKKTEQTNKPAPDANGTVAVDASAEGQQDSQEKGKKKKYERKVKVKLAGAVSNFLVLNAVSFRARYEGSGVYTFRVDKDQTTMLDDLCERLKE